MLTKDTLTAEVKELKDQYQKAQQQLFASKQQTEDLTATVDRLQGAIIVSEKYLALFDGKVESQAPAPAPNGTQTPMPVA